MGGKEKDVQKEKVKLCNMPCRGCRAGGRQRGTAAIETIQRAAGLEEQTMAYLLKYRYGDDLTKKMAAAIDK